MTLASKTLSVAAYVALAVTSQAHAQAARAPAPQVYSSMRYIEDTGDLVGTEVAITRAAGGGLCVSYQLAEGEPGPVRIVPGALRGDMLVFTIPPDSGYYMRGASRNAGPLVEIGPARVFRGRLSARGLRVPGYADVPGEWLPRRRVAYFPASVHQLSNMALLQTCRSGAPATRGNRTDTVRPERGE